MTREQVKEVLDRVLTWPPEKQDEAVEVLTALEAQDDDGWQLTDEQVAEVERRLADTGAPTLSLEELDARLRRLGV